MGTVETYKSTTPRIVSGQPVPAQHPWQDRDLRDFREREREREPHRPQIGYFRMGVLECFWSEDQKTQLWIQCLFDHPNPLYAFCSRFHRLRARGSEIRPTPRREHRERRSREKVQWQTYAFDHRASIKICVAWFSTLPGMRCQNHKAIGFLKGNTLLWFSWECRNHHDRAPLHAQNTKFAKLMGKVTRKFCGLKKSEQVSAVALVWVTFCRYVTCIHYTCITRSCFHSIHRL